MMMGKPENQPLQSFATRASAARSRFQEGSMNDRASAAPPADFLGPATAASDNEPLRYHGQRDDGHVYGYVQSRGYGASATTLNHGPLVGRLPEFGGGNATADNSSCRRSVQSAASAASTATDSSSSSRHRGFFAPLWDGVRERLRLTRSKSATTIAREAPQPRVPPVPAFDADGPAARGKSTGSAASAGGTRPAREDILENYHQLMKSGFFDAHAIKSTRHKPRPLSTPSFPSTAQNAAASSAPSPVEAAAGCDMRAPTRAPPPPPMPMHAPPPPPAPSAPAATGSTTTSASSTPAAAALRTVSESPSSPVPPPSSGRGTKRTHADVEPPTASETPARRLVKKLRKSTSRLASEVRHSAPPAVPSSSSAAANNNKHPSPVPEKAYDNATTVTTTTTNAIAAVASAYDEAASALGDSKKLTKRRSRKDIRTAGIFGTTAAVPASASRRRRVSRPGSSNSGGGGVRKPSSSTSSSRHSSPAPVPVSTVKASAAAAAAATRHPRAVTRRRSPSPAAPAASAPISSGSAPAPSRGEGSSIIAVPVPSFHYPQRVRVTRSSSGTGSGGTRGGGKHGGKPLAVVPDANRGIPHVPSIPRQFEGGLKRENNRDKEQGQELEQRDVVMADADACGDACGDEKENVKANAKKSANWSVAC